MKKKKFIILDVLVVITILLIVYPFIEIDTGNSIIKFSYSDDISEFEVNDCYSESYFYNEKYDVSIYGFDFKKFLVFHMIILDYKEGNVCETEYLLEEEYINNFLDNAVVEENSNNIDVEELIEGKYAIVSNTRYLGNDYQNAIWYVLDGKHEVMYIFYTDDLLVIQVGWSDEGPKYIAYK